MLADNKEEINIPEQHLFSIRPLNQQSKKIAVVCDFAPLECRKTFKLIRTIPTYHPQLDQPFQTEIGLHAQSMKNITERRQTSSAIMVAKPTNHFCQICRECFDDYLKHISHPLHQRRLKESEKSFSLDSLKEILQIKRKKPKKLTWFRDLQEKTYEQEETAKSSTSLEDSELKSQGSKKRIVLRQGEMQPMSVASSTRCEEQELYEEVQPVQRRLNRKFSNFRQLVENN